MFFSFIKKCSLKQGLFALVAVTAMALVLPITANAAPKKKAKATVSCAPSSGSVGGGTAPTATSSKARSGGIVLTRTAGETTAATLAGSEGMTPADECAPPGKAVLVNGRAIAPPDAPPRVKRVIAWANKIRTKPYIYGGGHRRFFDRGYDCSGAVSFGLRGGNFVRSPMPSTGYYRWGQAGQGRWITVYTHSGHAYMVVAGLRFDTSMTGGNGPRWSETMRSSRGFTARHPSGF